MVLRLWLNSTEQTPDVQVRPKHARWGYTSVLWPVILVPPELSVGTPPPRQPWRVQRFITHQPTRFSRSFLCFFSDADRGQTLDAHKQHCGSYCDWRNGAATPAVRDVEEENVWGIRETSKSFFFPWPYVMTSAMVIFVRYGNESKLGSC